MNLARKAVAEGVGTAMLLAIVVGSGIMGERLAGGNAAIALLANSIATGAGLFALIASIAPVSGAHFNPVVSLVAGLRRRMRATECGVYVGAQIAGAFAGVLLAHAMFSLPLLQTSVRLRSSPGEVLGETLATFGLVLVISLLSRYRSKAVALAVAGYITSAYWFTSSTSFANPAVTLARAATDTFSGIAPQSVPSFLGAQVLGGLLAMAFVTWLLGCEDSMEAPR